MSSYSRQEGEYSDEYLLNKIGKKEHEVMLARGLIRAVYYVRYKLYSLLSAAGISVAGLCVTFDHPNQMGQNPNIIACLQWVFANVSGIIAAEIIMGIKGHSQWKQTCQIMKEAGILKRFLQDTLRADPKVRQLIIDTAQEHGIDFPGLTEA